MANVTPKIKKKITKGPILKKKTLISAKFSVTSR